MPAVHASIVAQAQISRTAKSAKCMQCGSSGRVSGRRQSGGHTSCRRTGSDSTELASLMSANSLLACSDTAACGSDTVSSIQEHDSFESESHRWMRCVLALV